MFEPNFTILTTPSPAGTYYLVSKEDYNPIEIVHFLTWSHYLDGEEVIDMTVRFNHQKGSLDFCVCEEQKPFLSALYGGGFVKITGFTQSGQGPLYLKDEKSRELDFSFKGFRYEWRERCRRKGEESETPVLLDSVSPGQLQTPAINLDLHRAGIVIAEYTPTRMCAELKIPGTASDVDFIACLITATFLRCNLFGCRPESNKDSLPQEALEEQWWSSEYWREG